MQGQVFECVWALCICKALASEFRNEGQKDSAGSTPQRFTVTLQEYLRFDSENLKTYETCRFRCSLTWWFLTGAPWGNMAVQIIPHN